MLQYIMWQTQQVQMANMNKLRKARHHQEAVIRGMFCTSANMLPIFVYTYLEVIPGFCKSARAWACTLLASMK